MRHEVPLRQFLDRIAQLKHINSLNLGNCPLTLEQLASLSPVTDTLDVSVLNLTFPPGGSTKELPSCKIKMLTITLFEPSDAELLLVANSIFPACEDVHITLFDELVINGGLVNTTLATALSVFSPTATVRLTVRSISPLISQKPPPLHSTSPSAIFGRRNFLEEGTKAECIITKWDNIEETFVP